MSLFNLFKKKKKEKEEKKERELKKKPKKDKKEAKKEPVKEVKEKVFKPKEAKSDIAFRVLYFPHITEKATVLAEENKYVFRINPKANKTQVKRAIEDVYGVEVEKVRIVKIPPKQRRLGRQIGRKSGYKKAIVEIKKGQKLEILPR